MAATISANGEGLIISPEKKDPDRGQPEILREDLKVLCVGSLVSDVDYSRVAEILKGEQNFSLEGYKALTMKRRLAARVRAAGFSDLAGYITLLAGDEAEQQKLLAALSVHVSQFFRNPSSFMALKNKVLRRLFAQAGTNGQRLRFWSVGCAYGEEAYTLALICEEFRPAAESLMIIGSDLSSEAIRQARQGLYTAERLKGVPDGLRDRYFSNEEGRYRIAEEIRRQVRFFRHDILAEKPFYRADLILCRNLLIYFSREQQEMILRSLAETLTAGGYLMLGRAETLAPACRELFSCIDPAERIYQRTKEARDQLLNERHDLDGL